MGQFYRTPALEQLVVLTYLNLWSGFVMSQILSENYDTGTITTATQVSHKIGPRTLSKVESKNLDLDIKCFRIIVPG